MADDWKEASDFASFLVAQIEDEDLLSVIAYKLLNDLNIPFLALDEGDIRTAISNLADNFGREVDDEQYDEIVRLVKADRAYSYIDMAEGWESAYMESIVYAKMYDLGLTEKEEDE